MLAGSFKPDFPQKILALLENNYLMKWLKDGEDQRMRNIATETQAGEPTCGHLLHCPQSDTAHSLGQYKLHVCIISGISS